MSLFDNRDDRGAKSRYSRGKSTSGNWWEKPLEAEAEAAKKKGEAEAPKKKGNGTKARPTNVLGKLVGFLTTLAPKK
jgi:hypothetical protein